MQGEELSDFGGGVSHEGELPAKDKVATEESARTPAIRLVLNGGGTTMDSATVPVEWFFSETLLAERPQYVVLFDHEFSLEEMKKRRSYDGGHRYLVPVKELVKYVQFSRPGRHHLICAVFCGDEKEAFKQAHQWVCGSSVYNKNFWMCQDGDILAPENGCGTTVVEFEVPEALFAQRSESRAAKLLLGWANLFFNREPRDQCAYRKRLIFAFSAQPPIALAMWFVLGILGTLYTFVGCFFVAFFGFRPAHFVDNLKRAWLWKGAFDFDLTEWGEWRRWDDGNGLKRKYIPIWGVPTVVLFGLSTVLHIVRLAIKYPHVFIKFLVVPCAAAALVILILYLLRRAGGTVTKIENELNKRMSASSARRTEARRVKDEQRIERLRESLSLEANTGVTHVDVPVVARRVESNVTRFKLSFWATKAKVCKPFAKH